MDNRSLQDTPFEEAWDFILKLGSVAHGYGSNSPRLEMFLTRLTRAFGFEGVFRSSPSEILFAVQESPETPQRVQVMGFQGSGFDLDKLARVGDLLDDVDSGQVTVREASRKLDEISRRPEPWGVAAIGASYAFSGAGFSALLGGGWADVVASTVLSLVVYAIVLVSGRMGREAELWIPVSTALVAGFAATALRHWIPDLSPMIVLVSAIISLIPGYGVTKGVIETVSGHTHSGIADLMESVTYLTKQVLGALLGISLATGLVTLPPGRDPVSVDSAWLWVFVPLLIVGLCLSFQTSRRDFPWATLSGVIAYAGMSLGDQFGGPHAGTLMGTIALVAFANLWTARTGRPTSIVLLPAIMLLVGGSIGFRGLAAIAGGDTGLGLEEFLQMFTAALTIAVGLVAGNTLVRPKTSL